jgi:hypothetical protein
VLKDFKKNNKLPDDTDFAKEIENTSINSKRYFYISLFVYLVIMYELCKLSYIAPNQER